MTIPGRGATRTGEQSVRFETGSKSTPGNWELTTDNRELLESVRFECQLSVVSCQLSVLPTGWNSTPDVTRGRWDCTIREKAARAFRTLHPPVQSVTPLSTSRSLPGGASGGPDRIRSETARDFRTRHPPVRSVAPRWPLPTLRSASTIRARCCNHFARRGARRPAQVSYPSRSNLHSRKFGPMVASCEVLVSTRFVAP